jgi:uncharacterized protein (DUF362 family)
MEYAREESKAGFAGWSRLRVFIGKGVLVAWAKPQMWFVMRFTWRDSHVRFEHACPPAGSVVTWVNPMGRTHDPHGHTGLSRRDFLRAAGGAAAAAALAQACRVAGVSTPTGIPSMPVALPLEPTATEPLSPTTTPSSIAPSPTPESLLGRVALVRTQNRSEGVRRALDILGINPVQGKRVFLKPNFNSADPTPGSTHTDVLRAYIQRLWDMGARSLTLGDRSGMGNTRAVMQAKGVFDLARELGFDVVVFDELGADGWVPITPPAGSHWRRGFDVARPCLEAEAIVQTCNLKTHRFGGHFTLSLKNGVGLAAKSVPGEGYNYMTELHNSARQRSMIADVNTAYAPALILLDGVDAFVDGGPDVGTKANPGVLLAGVDRVAIDAAGVAILRDLGTNANVRSGPVFEQEQLARAVALGLGVSHPEEITFLTEDQPGRDYADKLREILLGPGG